MKKTTPRRRRLQQVALGTSMVISAATLIACGGSDDVASTPAPTPAPEVKAQPVISARAKPTLTNTEGQSFKDLNGNGQVDAYEDWRRPIDERVNDLVAKMSLGEKAGMMLIDTLNAPVAPNAIANTNANRFINTEKMTRFIFRNAVQVGSTTNVSPQQAAEFTNSVQEMAESTRLGIPALFKSNARNHYDRNTRQGINEPAGSFSEWPKEAGLSATRDMALIKDFAETMGAEWNSIGLRGMYGYMADLSTEPRWYRVHETFTEDADLATDIMTTLVTTLQGGPVNPASKVALTMKHFPGGGPQEMGLDPHYAHGKNQIYPGGNFGYHLKPWIAAVNAGVSSIMPYYGVPINVTYEGVKYEQIGMAFSKQIVTDLLRGTLGFKGNVNSDTGIIDSRAWGLENKSVPERVAAAINAGTDTLSGFNNKQTIIDLVNAGLISTARVDAAVKVLLHEQFALGLFENPYVDASKANGIVGNDAFRAKALDAQRKSLTLLQNQSNTLPLRAPTAGAPVNVYTMGLNPTVVGDAQYGGYQVVNGDRTTANGNTRTPVAAGTDYAVIRVEVSNPRAVTSTYRSSDAATGGRINPATGQSWGSVDPTGVDNGLGFGGSFPWEAGMLSFTEMAAAESWSISPSLADIKAVMTEIGDPKKVVLNVYFRQPYVLDDASGLKNAGAILANFGVSDVALMDVLTGKGGAKPQGKLPFALANKASAITTQNPDTPGYPAADTLYPFGHGLGY